MYFPRIEDLRIDSDRKQYEVAAYLHLNREVLIVDEILSVRQHAGVPEEE